MLSQGDAALTTLILLALNRLRGYEKPVNIEDLAVECFKMAPSRFALTRHPHYPNLESVRRRLQSDAKPAGWVMGSNKRGWMLTPAGLAELDRYGEAVEATIIGVGKPSVDRRQLHQLVERVTKHAGYRKFTSRAEEPAEFELLESFGCNVNTSPEVVAERLNAMRTRALQVERLEVVAYADYCENRLLRRNRKGT